jgi:P27 family predicted phage terminase small subunit
MGRLTTTKSSKQKKGTDRKRPKKTVKGLMLEETPKIPRKWSRQMKDLFRDSCRSLIERNLLFEGDLPLLIMYCKEVTNYFDLCERVGTDYLVNGSMGQLVQNPLLKIANTSLQNSIKLGKEFGFSPYSKRLVGEGIINDEEENDPFQQLLNS